MRRAILAVLIAAFLSLSSFQSFAHYPDIELLDALDYLIDFRQNGALIDHVLDDGIQPPAVSESPGDSGVNPVFGLMSEFESEFQLGPIADGDSETYGAPDPATEYLTESPVPVDLELDDTVSSFADSCDDQFDGFFQSPREVSIAEEAIYVRVMSEGRASVREIRSLDLCAGRSTLELANMPTSIVENSIFLSVWNAPAEVEISGYRLVHADDSATLYVEVIAMDNVLGASLEVNYVTDDLYASLSYTGFFDSDSESLLLSEWLTVTNDSGKRFENAMFSFSLAELGFGHSIPSSVTLPSGEKRLFLSNDYALSPARTIVTAEVNPDSGLYEVTELIKVEGLQDRGLLIPFSPATIYSLDLDGFVSLCAQGKIHKPKEYSWFTVRTLDQPDVTVQRVKTGDEVTGSGSIRDVSYMINIDNDSPEPVVVTIYEYMGTGSWIVISATVDAKPISHSRDLSRREYATFTVEVPADSSRALFYKARIDER